MSYAELFVVAFLTAADPQRVRVAGPFPAIEPAEEFARALRERWPGGGLTTVDVAQVENSDPISELWDAVH